MDLMKRILPTLFLFAASLSFAASVQCEIENGRIYCKYFLDRSDNQNGKEVEFHWISPKSPEDDRIRHFRVPPLHGSVYDYRFLPGRMEGRWHVKVKDLETNSTVETFFDINSTDDSLFEED